MRRKTQRAIMRAMGYTPFEPTEEQRKMVTVLKFNGVPHQRIANVLHLSLVELEYHFKFELDLGQDTLLGHATENILWLADQKLDLGVAFRANSSLLVNRVKGFREPQVDANPSESEISDMTLPEIEAHIARLERERRTAAEAAQAAAGNDPDEDEPA